MTTLTELSDIADEVIQVVNEVVNKTPQDLWEPTITAIIEIYHHHLDLVNGRIRTHNEVYKNAEDILENKQSDKPSA